MPNFESLHCGDVVDALARSNYILNLEPKFNLL